MMRVLPLFILAISAQAAAGDAPDVRAGLDLRYRHEDVRQDDKPATAAADTLRLRFRLAAGAPEGWSALAELDRLEAIGDTRYDDTRNGRTRYPVIADPEGTDLDQAWVQYKGGKSTVRIGRQRINIDRERFVGSVGWRQNEQAFDALRVESRAIPGIALDYIYSGRVRRVFGPHDGTPPADLEGDVHFLGLKLESLPAGALTLFALRAEFDEAPQLSSGTIGFHYEGDHAAGDALRIGWRVEYARQRDAGDNAARIDAWQGLAELRLESEHLVILAGNERLSGEAGTFTAATNPAFQTPLATLHRFQGWADKFLTTPSAGIDDRYVALTGKRAGWVAQAQWHDYGAEATAQDYGRELDLSLARKFAGRYELLLKYADYDARGLLTDTRKLWLQLGASFGAK